MAFLEDVPVSRSRTSTYESGGKEVITSRLDTYILKTLPEDILRTLRTVAGQELDAQITSGNLPSQILVDGRSVARRGINSAIRSVSMRFADTQTLVDAVRVAYRVMLSVTRIQQPPKNSVVARKNFWLYLNGRPLGLLPGALASLDQDQLNYKSILRIVGPLVPYGRKSFWNPIGRSKIMEFKVTTSLAGRETTQYDGPLSPRFKPARRRTLQRLANAAPGDKAANLRRLLATHPGTVEGANQIARRVLGRDRRFKAIHFSDGWISYPPAGSWGKSSRDDRVPTLSVQLSRKGGIQILKESL